jgi:protoheme IX farnesyltransferase
MTRTRDLIELGKPRLSILVIFTTAAGLWLAPDLPDLPRSALFLVATACLVAAANALNCWLECEIDGRMLRTRDRPLPAGRVDSRLAVAYGIALAAASLVVLWFVSNPLTTLLGLIALLTYVLLYTPLKRFTPWAVLVGAIPGAIPPLMGWTAATGALAPAGWYLFGILILWQMPHFIAISINLEDDYRRGGIPVLPIAKGERAARRHLFAWSVVLVVYTLAGPLFGLAGPYYTAVAAALGLAFLALVSTGLRRTVDGPWARRVFGFTLLYLPLLVALLVLDAP